MAMHETEDSKVFQRFKKKTAPEPHQVKRKKIQLEKTNVSTFSVCVPLIVFCCAQVVRYSRGGSPLWVSSQHIPSDHDIPPCTCGAQRTYEFQVVNASVVSFSFFVLTTAVNANLLLCTSVYKTVPPCVWSWMEIIWSI